MPYIEPATRSCVDPDIDQLVSKIKHEMRAAEDPGVLNYVIFAFLKRVLDLPGKTRYKKLHLADGVLSNVGREIYRRYAAPYEDQKIETNGDVE